MPGGDRAKTIFLLVLWGAAFSPLWPQLVRDWVDHSDNSHAFLVPFIALYLVKREWHELRTTDLGSSVRGGVLLAASLTIYVVSYAGGAAFPARLAMVSSLFGLAWYCLGSGIIRIVAFPICFLLFMIPVPYSLMSLVSMPLQLMATRIAATLIETCSIPVYREGNMLYFMQTQLEVAEACSGIRSIMALTMLGLLFSHVSRGEPWSKALLVVSAIPIAMLANIVRVTGTGVLANFYGDKVARGFLHEFSGLVIFAFGFTLLYAVFSITNRREARDVH